MIDGREEGRIGPDEKFAYGNTLKLEKMSTTNSVHERCEYTREGAEGPPLNAARDRYATGREAPKSSRGIVQGNGGSGWPSVTLPMLNRLYSGGELPDG
jgi:hypothetical protein